MEINIYTIPTCPWCTKLKEWLKKKKASFIEHDLTESDHARDEMIGKSDQLATPVTIFKYDDEKEEIVIVGFDEKELEAAFKG
ncbi:glutaredoxin family protein [Candidatus Woesearchaeota archaeon]|jgi:glutaredoxin 3|nr:glutaredoxin family protein [Candidatus Woesearchaeota archaeon]